MQFRKEERLLLRAVVMPRSRGWIEPIGVVHPSLWWPLQNTGFCLKKMRTALIIGKLTFKIRTQHKWRCCISKSLKWDLWEVEAPSSAAKLGGECQKNAISLLVYKGYLVTRWCYRFHHRQWTGHPFFGFAMNMLCFYLCSNAKLPGLKVLESPSAWAMKSKFLTWELHFDFSFPCRHWVHYSYIDHTGTCDSHYCPARVIPEV